jgi:hypothetical protein
LLLSVSGIVNATLINVTWTESQTVSWVGQVDTTLNRLTISALSDNVGGNAFWTPTNAIIFDAVQLQGGTNQSNLVSYNITDAWNGVIGTNWGFTSALSKSAISWNEGAFTAHNAKLGFGIRVFNDLSVDTNVGTEFFGYNPYTSNDNEAFGQGTATFSVVGPVDVPEPTTLAIFALGMIGLASRRFKKQS